MVLKSASREYTLTSYKALDTIEGALVTAQPGSAGAQNQTGILLSSRLAAGRSASGGVRTTSQDIHTIQLVFGVPGEAHGRPLIHFCERYVSQCHRVWDTPSGDCRFVSSVHRRYRYRRKHRPIQHSSKIRLGKGDGSLFPKIKRYKKTDTKSFLKS